MKRSKVSPVWILICIFDFCLLIFDSHIPPAWPLAKRPPLSPETSGREVKTPPLTLEACYQRALKRSEKVQMEKEDIKAAEAQFFKATGEAVGDMDFVMTFQKQQELRTGEGGSVSGSFTDPDRRERKFTLQQPIFRGFRALGALTGAGSLKKEQKGEWIRAKQLLFLDVANAFYSLLREKKNLLVLNEVLQLYQERLKDLEAREQIGRSRATELVSAKARMKVAEAERARAQRTYAVAQDLLEFLTGISLENRELQEEPLPETEIQELNGYLEVAPHRADVEAARQAVKTARSGVLVAQSDFWPEVTLEHNRYNRREGLQADIDWDLLFKVDVPLFRGGETVGKVKEAMSHWRRGKLEYSLAERTATLEIKQAYDQWHSSVAETKALDEAVKASEENFRLQREDYEHDLVSNLDVLEALESLERTRLDANRSYYEMKTNYWNLQIAAGKTP